MILTFIFGSLIAFLGRFGGDAMGLVSYIMSIDNFNGTNPLEVAAAYAAFANGGYYIKPYTVTKIVYMGTNQTKEYKSELISIDKKILKEINFTKGKILQYLIYEKSENNLVIQSNKDRIYIYDVFNNKNEYKKIKGESIQGNNFNN